MSNILVSLASWNLAFLHLQDALPAGKSLILALGSSGPISVPGAGLAKGVVRKPQFAARGDGPFPPLAVAILLSQLFFIFKMCSAVPTRTGPVCWPLLAQICSLPRERSENPSFPVPVPAVLRRPQFWPSKRTSRVPQDPTPPLSRGS